MVEAAESVWMMDAAYRGGRPLSTHILCLQGIRRLGGRGGANRGRHHDAFDVVLRRDRDDPRGAT